jgi:hypothetical protein
MTYSGIKRQSMKIYKAAYSRCIIEKDAKGNIMRFTCVLLHFKASAAETRIFHSLEYVFLESAVHRLSVNSLLVYQKTVHEDTKQFISSA